METVRDVIAREVRARSSSDFAQKLGFEAPVGAASPETGVVAGSPAAARSLPDEAVLIRALRRASDTVTVMGGEVYLRGRYAEAMPPEEALGLGLALIDAALQAGRA